MLILGANKALYEINRRMYLDIDAAKILGMDEGDIAQTSFDKQRREQETLVI